MAASVTSSSLRSNFGWVVGLRLVALLITSVATLASTAVVAHAFGTRTVGTLSLAMSITQLVMLADLGMGAVISNAVVDYRSNAVADALTSIRFATRLMWASAVVVIATILVVQSVGAWPLLLGKTLEESEIVALVISLCLAGVAIPLTRSQAIAIGLGAVHVNVVSGIARPLVILGFCAAAAVAHANASWTLVSPALGLIASQLMITMVLRRVRRKDVRAYSGADARERSTGQRLLLRTGGYMSVVNVALPLILATDQLVLSHVAPAGLPEYAMIAQLYLPVWALMTAAGLTLWSHFGTARSVRRKAPEVWTLVAWFAGAGVAGAGALSLAASTLPRAITGGRISPSLLTIACFAALLILQSACLPLGMYLTGHAGLRVQAIVLASMAIVNMPLAIVLAKDVGAGGPALASALLVCALQVPVYAYVVWRNPRIDWKPLCPA